MEKHINKVELYCDYCKNQIFEREFFKNDGSYQKDSIKLLNFDVCKKCALEVLDKLSKNIEEDKIKEIFENRKSKIESKFDFLFEEIL